MCYRLTFSLTNEIQVSDVVETKGEILSGSGEVRFETKNPLLTRIDILMLENAGRGEKIAPARRRAPKLVSASF